MTSNTNWNEYYINLMINSMTSKKDLIELGVFYENSDWKNLIDFNIIHNKIKELELIQKKNHYAIFHLGLSFAFGLNCEKNNDKANEYYHMSAELNNVFALNNLGYRYENNGDIKKAITYYHKSSIQNYNIATNNLKTIFIEHPHILSELLFKVDELEEKNKEINDLQNRLSKLEKLVTDMIIYSPGEIGEIETKEHFEELVEKQCVQK